MAKSQLEHLARLGAEARLKLLDDERNTILAMFPDLRRGQGTGRAGTASAAPEKAGRGRKRRGMSAAQRKAVGERMRAYWAARRAGQPTESGSAESEPSNGTSRPRRKTGRKK